MMRKTALLCMILLATADCKQVTPEEQIAEIGTYFNQYENSFASKLSQLDEAKRTDYLTLVQAKDLDADEVWLLETDEGQALVAEYPGRKPKKGEEPQLSLLSAPLDDPQACASALAVIEAFRKMKIRPASTIRTAFYSTASDSTMVSGLTVLREDLLEAGEVVSYNLDLTTSGDEAPHTFIIEENSRFVEQFLSVLPPYFKPLGEYRFRQGTFPNTSWPINAATYRYTLNRDELPHETAAVATLIYLLN